MNDVAPQPSPDEPRHGPWRTSSYSEPTSQCVEVAPAADGGRWLRDSKDRARPAHHFTAAEWVAFIRGVKDGEFDL